MPRNSLPSVSVPGMPRMPKAGERFRLHPRFMDYTTDPVIDFLEQLDGEGGGLRRLWRAREPAGGPLPLPADVESAAAAAEPALRLTPSQAGAYRAIRRRRAVAVWGPPGSGKTHFVATVILGLIDAHARAGRPFRVLVTAFTHAAIENLLRKVEQRRGEVTGLAVAPARAKAKGWARETP